MNEKERLVIIDSNSLLHRAYHALPSLTTKKGELVNAIYGFLLVFLKALRELQPNFIAAAFDFPAPTFRHQKFKGYKAERPKAPEEFYSQIPKVKEILREFNVQIFEKEGYEADDLIGTISNLAPKKQIIPELEIIILSGDLDNLQLVNSFTKVYNLKKGIKDTILYDKKEVKEKYQGLSPEQLVDFRALRGDPSDSIPGVSGIGEKTAIKLLKQFGSLENVYQELEAGSEESQKLKPKLKELLLCQKEQAFLSKDLAQIEKNAKIDFDLEKCRWKGFDKSKVIKKLENLEFQSLIKRLSNFENKLK